MRNRIISIVLASFMLVSANGRADAEQTSTALQIYLPREITIEGDVPNLGQVAIIRGEEHLIAKARQVTLGRISAPGQKIIIDRTAVLSRLASSGIKASEVTLTGAEKITVSQRHQIIKGDEFTEKALSFLKKNPPKASICQWNVIRKPKDLILSDISKDIKLSYRFAKSNMKNMAKVFVSVFSGDKEMGVWNLLFKRRNNEQ